MRTDHNQPGPSDEVESVSEDDDSDSDSIDNLPLRPTTILELKEQRRKFREEYEEMRFVVGQDSNTDLATAELIPALLWNQNWMNTREWDEQGVSHPKHNTNRSPRTMFPSWTWAGWKRTQEYKMQCHCRPYSGRWDYRKRDCLIQSPIKVSEDGYDLNWTTDNKRIIEMSDLGNIPTSLVLTGKVIEVELACRKEIKGYGKEFVWTYTSPSRFKGHTVTLPPGYVDEGEGEVLTNLLLLLLARTPGTSKGRRKSGHEPWYYFLLLRPVEDGADVIVYERLITEEMMESYLHTESGNMLYDLETREVRIR